MHESSAGSFRNGDGDSATVPSGERATRGRVQRPNEVTTTGGIKDPVKAWALWPPRLAKERSDRRRQNGELAVERGAI